MLDKNFVFSYFIIFYFEESAEETKYPKIFSQAKSVPNSVRVR